MGYMYYCVIDTHCTSKRSMFVFCFHKYHLLFEGAILTVPSFLKSNWIPGLWVRGWNGSVSSSLSWFSSVLLLLLMLLSCFFCCLFVLFSVCLFFVVVVVALVLVSMLVCCWLIVHAQVKMNEWKCVYDTWKPPLPLSILLQDKTTKALSYITWQYSQETFTRKPSDGDMSIKVRCLGNSCWGNVICSSLFQR